MHTGKDTCQNDVNTVGMIAVIVSALFCAYMLQGCMPLVTGIKEIRTSGGTEYKFITGADFRFGANGVDTVDDHRGIKPGEGYAAGR